MPIEKCVYANSSHPWLKCRHRKDEWIHESCNLKHDEWKSRYLVLTEQKEMKPILLREENKNCALSHNSSWWTQSYVNKWIHKNCKVKDFLLHTYSISIDKLIKEKFRDVHNLITRTRKWKRRQMGRYSVNFWSLVLIPDCMLHFWHIIPDSQLGGINL